MHILSVLDIFPQAFMEYSFGSNSFQSPSYHISCLCKQRVSSSYVATLHLETTAKCWVQLCFPLRCLNARVTFYVKCN